MCLCILSLILIYATGSSVGFLDEKDIFLNQKTISQNNLTINGSNAQYPYDFGKRNPKSANKYFVPEYFDWRDQGMVSPVKDQGSCEGCWAFSAVANIERQLKIHRGIEVLLSEQFLIDCEKGNRGCSAGSVVVTFADIVSRLGGVLQAKDYPSFSERQMVCRWNGQPQPIPVTGYKRVRQNEKDMVTALYNNGPLSALISAKSMVNYKGNYIDDPDNQSCPQDIRASNHAVLIVGYNVYVEKDTGKSTPYWVIKNSWGKKWGDSGFYYLIRGKNACGIANDVSFAFVK